MLVGGQRLGESRVFHHEEGDAVRGHDARPFAPVFEHGAGVGEIILIEQGQKVKAVGKNGFHTFFGWPLT